MEDEEIDILRCYCKGGLHCSQLHQQLEEGNEEIFNGCFTIRKSKIEKLLLSKKQAHYQLGISISLYKIRIRKHHFAMEVLEYLGNKKSISQHQ